MPRGTASDPAIALPPPRPSLLDGPDPSSTSVGGPPGFTGVGGPAGVGGASSLSAIIEQMDQEPQAGHKSVAREGMEEETQLPPPAPVEAFVGAYHAAHPRDAHGVHRYQPTDFGIEPAEIDADEAVEQEGVTILIDPKASLFIFGTEMDFVEEKMQSGFVFRNPNEKGRCGCGESFGV